MGKLQPLLLLFLLFNLSAWAQNTVKGKVTNAKTGLPLADVSISVVGGKTGSGVTTDSAGNFSLKLNSRSSGKLMISAIGYKNHLVELDGKDFLTVQLSTVAATLDDVVVIGYGAQKKSHLTGSIAKLKNDNLDEIPTSSLDKALIGKMAGVTVQNLSSEVGTTPRVRVRGLSSISANADPLVVVDGHPVPDGLAMVNPYDVESVEVLKDAASAAIYGSRGANGVIIITTKSGKTNKPKYTVKSYYGVKSAYKLHPIMSTSEYTEKCTTKQPCGQRSHRYRRQTKPHHPTGKSPLPGRKRIAQWRWHRLAG
ncbi:TonB-dependent receptor plug domain-containing protein [Paraflavitalea speifideaquila]|uniref:TonB-dependent receptor plug domain-containing protein n=1 Tax=Paraflavitalea speifideaquila TaxID=3076558 RepID=UPI0028EC7A4E|nr:TonB-dependent receptor plug domain-containing protein [Paraflavitalea speifideiaquila]